VNNLIYSDWQFRFAPLPAGYAGRKSQGFSKICLLTQLERSGKVFTSRNRWGPIVAERAGEMQNYLSRMEKTYMKRLNVLAVFFSSVFFALVLPAHGKQIDDNDKVTLTINATCVADATGKTSDSLLKEKVTGTLRERAVYRIVSSEGGRLELELIDNQTSIEISGGGTYKSPIESASWTLKTGHPPTRLVQGGVSIDTLHGTGNINMHNFMRQVEIKASPEDPPGGRFAVDMAEMAIEAANSIPPGVFFDSNESFLKELNFTFDPKSKRISAGGQANYQTTWKDESDNIASTSRLSVNYTVTSGVPEELRAVLIPKGDYKKWLPRATVKGPDTPGNTITFDVELRNPQGGKAEEKTAQFEIELLETSRHPGSTMNSPWTGVDPDLKILKINNPALLDISAEGQKAKTAKGLKSAPITISSFDGAAIGKLTVLARIDGEDTVLTAQLDSHLTEVSIPYDLDGSTIADAWEEANDVLGKPSDSDEDAEPQGDGHNGDGLTVWEEYRGFLEDGKHIRTKPQQKDLFICDTYGGRSKRGINRFAALTKLDVHDKLTLEELSPSRVINRNRGEDAPHVVDQHGLLLDGFKKTEKSLISGMAVPAQGEPYKPGTPKSFDRIILDRAIEDTVTRKLEGGTTKTYEFFTPFVAHELLHCCNVWHHGEEDGVVYWKAEEVDGKKTMYEYVKEADCGSPEKGEPIRVLHENGGEYSPDSPEWPTCMWVWLGEEQGQHSGVEDCVMRYSVSMAYRGVTGTRYIVHGEPQESVGQGLCNISPGTGVNKAGRKPFPRYGDADKGRGACAHKICVNDWYH